VTGPVHIPLDRIIPSHGEILHAQGIPRTTLVRENIRSLVGKSLVIFSAEAHPRCVASDIGREEFDDIFPGEGFNDPEAPLKQIYPRADRLALFALTIGEKVSRSITEYFQTNDFALGSILDAVASLAAERSVEYLEEFFAAECATNSDAASGRVALNYSPGYCGWHISAQKKVFQYLHPERIGITLNDSYLMTPLKSATGLLVYGEKTIHTFDNGFGFCSACREQTCLERRDRLSGVHHSTPRE
jgi:Vitamin B12 dependent methionine synthase, activation domain